jgi:fused signal recognition particle receptor
MANKGKKKPRRKRPKGEGPKAVEATEPEGNALPEKRSEQHLPHSVPIEKKPEPIDIDLARQIIELEPPEGGTLMSLEDLEEPPPPEVPEEEEDSARIRRGMFRSRKLFSRPFTRAATRRAIDPQFWDEMVEVFIAADTGVEAAEEIVAAARDRVFSEGLTDLEEIKQVFRDSIAEMIESFGTPPPPPEERPRILFIVGINGVGKTTTAAKIGFLFRRHDNRVLFAAADTFRAAGIEQMEMWANRIGAPVVRHKTGGDPAAVVFDAVESGKARNMDVVIIDTAGRLHTKKNLMEELSKMWRVADRQLEESPQAVLVIDATTGQNGVNQARIFSGAMDIGSIALTKMDGTAKGGVVIAIGRELGIPVEYIGMGEGMADLRPFVPEEYARALI